VIEPAYLLDSNICIFILADARGASARAVQQQDVGRVVTSSVAYAEVMRGVPIGEHEAFALARRLFERIEPLPFDRDAADAYVRLPFRRARFDRLIAAHALSRGLVLVTNNPRDFADIAGLKVENWCLS